MKQEHKKKAIWIVLDSAGIGALPDAGEYGDVGANTFGRIADTMPFLQLPYLNGLGLDVWIPQFTHRQKVPSLFPCCTMRLAEQSKGKDTITGHWELAGIVTKEAIPTYPHGFPNALLQQIKEQTGYIFLGNEVASGTEIIARLGEEHQRTGKPILYTSADSVLQIAAHEEVLPVPKLYQLCKTIRKLTEQAPYKVGRIIARPFIGSPGNYRRTSRRHDFALQTPEPNLLQALLTQGKQVYSVGKIQDIFSGIAFSKAVHTTNNADGMQKTLEYYSQLENGLLFVNLVDFDMLYGHRRNSIGYGTALAEFDQWLPQLLQMLDDDTVLAITADHGCDPGFHGTDHTREYVPLFLTGAAVQGDMMPKMRTSFADVASTFADYFSVPYTAAGVSFAKEGFR